MKCYQCGAKISMPEQLKDYAISLVEFYTGVSLEQMASNRKMKRYYFSRFIAMHILYTYWIENVDLIGKVFNRDHTSVSHAMKTIKGWRRYDQNVEELVGAIEKQMQAKRKEILEESFSQ